MFPKTDHTKMGMNASHGHIELSCRMSPCQSQKYRLFSFVYLSKYLLLYIACLQTAENELTIITTEAGFKLANVRLTNVRLYCPTAFTYILNIQLTDFNFSIWSL